MNRQTANSAEFSLTGTPGVSMAGQGICTFQAGQRSPNSDWGFELEKARDGRPSSIRSTHGMPDFDRDRQHVLNRAAEMGNAFRFSIDGTLICPTPEAFNEEEMFKAMRLCVECRNRGMEPFITLHHWPMPKAFAEYDDNGKMQKGPLQHPRIVEWFARYTQSVAEYFFNPEKIVKFNTWYVAQGGTSPAPTDRPLCSTFLTINEPTALHHQSYIQGIFPPHKLARFDLLPSLMRKVRDMHQSAYHALHNAEAKYGRLYSHDNPPRTLRVGMSHARATSNVRLIQDISRAYMEWIERRVQTDLVAIQYHARFQFALTLPGIITPDGTDPHFQHDFPGFGQVDPSSLLPLLEETHKLYPKKNIILSEFGFADDTDRKRPFWMVDSMRYIAEAIRRGVPLQGMFGWTLMDNLEWCEGTRRKFGILDHQGHNKPGDAGDESALSSRRVWQASQEHFLHPTAGSADTLTRLHRATHVQLLETVSRERRPGGKRL